MNDVLRILVALYSLFVIGFAIGYWFGRAAPIADLNRKLAKLRDEWDRDAADLSRPID